MGVAGKLLIVLLISLALTASVSFSFPPLFRITENYRVLLIAAAAMAVVGFSLNLIAAFGMLSAYRNERLATGGLYAYFLNPMYTFQLLVTVPGLLLLFNSWLVMLAIVPAFIAFKVFAKEEERFLEEKFGDRYRDYQKKVLFKFL